jgi:hypothetical protein
MPGRAVRYTAGAVALVITCIVVVVVLVPSGAIPPPLQSQLSALGQRLGVPAYIDPTTDPAAWTALSSAKPGAVGIVVANVDNGPGSQPVAAWSSALQRMRDNGSRVLGYVDTGYLGNPSDGRTMGLPTRAGATGVQAWLAQVEADVNAWYQFYGSDIGGIFLDESTSDCGPTAGSTEYADLYRTLSGYIKQTHPGSLTALNPGTAVAQCYRNSADVLVTFEGTYQDYTAPDAVQGQAYQPLTWSPSGPHRIWHIVYGATSLAELDQALALSRSRKAGYVYVTSAAPPNPFDSLPVGPYWTVEQDAGSS